MITGGNATVMVSDMDRAVDFYTRVLGLELRTSSATPTGTRSISAR